MIDNKKYFEYSQKHRDDVIDFSNPNGTLVISQDAKEKDTPLMKANCELIELITTYKTLKGIRDDDDHICEIIDRIIKIIETTKLINYSSFCVYFQVVGYSYDAYMHKKNKLSKDGKRKLFAEMIDLYIENRHDMYLLHGYSNQVLQVCSDSASSRRKGKVGIEMIEKILKKFDFQKIDAMSDFEHTKFAYILPDKGQKRLFDKYLEEKKIEFKFRNSRDSKSPDFLLKIDNKIFIMEHKMTNGSGGSQNAEINEIIQFIDYDEPNAKNVGYISCLAGNYLEKLNERQSEPKSKTQFENIVKNLEKHPKNFFVNSNGFTLLIDDLVK